MKRSTMFLLSSGATILISVTAHASYTGLQVTLQHIMLQNGTPLNVYRVYAAYSNPNDYLTAVAGSPTIGNLVIQSRDSTGSSPGSTFYNDPPGGGITAPLAYYVALDPDLQWDTFVTIGVSIADQAPGGDQTKVSPGFHGIGDVTELNNNNVGWFTNPTEQGRAGFLGDGDPLLRVLCMQLTVSSTSSVRGTVSISGINDIPLAGGQGFLTNGQTFNSIPLPGALPLVGLAALLIRGRRRSSRIVVHPHLKSGGAS